MPCYRIYSTDSSRSADTTSPDSAGTESFEYFIEIAKDADADTAVPFHPVINDTIYDRAGRPYRSQP